MKLNKDDQFTPTLENVSALLKNYALELVSFKHADSGIENCTVILQNNDGKYVLRVYPRNKKKDEEIQTEVDFINYLDHNGLPVTPLLASTNDTFITHLNDNDSAWQAILMHYVRGSHPTHYTPSMMGNLATLQATMHNLSAEYLPENIYAQELRVLKEEHFIQLISSREALDLRLQHFIDRAENYVVKLDELLPKGLCHLDFDIDNFLSEGDTITAILDFDDIAIAPYVMCLAYTLWDLVYDVGLNGITQYLKTYETIRPLSQLEKTFIKPIVLFRHYMIGCKEIADEHVDEEMINKYLELEHELLNFREFDV